jgi:hypothetical protein
MLGVLNQEICLEEEKLEQNKAILQPSGPLVLFKEQSVEKYLG